MRMILAAVCSTLSTLPVLHGYPLMSTDDFTVANTTQSGTNLLDLGTTSTVFEDIVTARLDILRQQYGPIHLQEIIAYTANPPRGATSDPDGFPNLAILYAAPRLQRAFWTERTPSPSNESGYGCSEPRPNPEADFAAVWSWGGQSSTLREQLAALQSHGIYETYTSFILWQLVPPHRPQQLVWTFYLDRSRGMPRRYSQGDRDRQLIDLHAMRILGAVGPGFNESGGISAGWEDDRPDLVVAHNGSTVEAV